MCGNVTFPHGTALIERQTRWPVIKAIDIVIEEGEVVAVTSLQRCGGEAEDVLQ